MGKLSLYAAQRAFMREKERLGTADARHFREEETSRFCGLRIAGGWSERWESNWCLAGIKNSTVGGPT